VASNPPAELLLTPLTGEGRPLREWLDMFLMSPVVLDPYTNQSAWVLKTARRVLDELTGAGVRTCFIVTADAEGARAFLGPIADEVLTFVDPDRVAVKALGLERLPAFLLLLSDGTVAASAEGWHPLEWRSVADRIAAVTAWSRPTIPAPGDPAPFEGTPALA